MLESDSTQPDIFLDGANSFPWKAHASIHIYRRCWWHCLPQRSVPRMILNPSLPFNRLHQQWEGGQVPAGQVMTLHWWMWQPLRWATSFLWLPLLQQTMTELNKGPVKRTSFFCSGNTEISFDLDRYMIYRVRYWHFKCPAWIMFEFRFHIKSMLLCIWYNFNTNVCF